MPLAPELPQTEDFDTTFHAPISDGELVDIIQQHLILGGEPLTVTQSQGSFQRPTSIASPRIDSDRNEIEGVVTPFHLPGTAMTNDIYKMANDLVQRNLRRSRSLTDLMEYRKQQLHSDPALQNINKPGGFRRYFVHQNGSNTPSEDGYASPLQRYSSMMDHDVDNLNSPREYKRTRHFLEFLAMAHIGIFDNFAGEDLEDTDDDIPVEDEEQARLLPVSNRQVVVAGSTNERTPLLRRKSSHMADKGTASETKAIFLLLKAFIGSGVLFLPRAFSNGGLLFSFISMWAMGAISLFSFLLLIECKDHVSGSYGDLGGVLYGPWMRRLVLFSVSISQVSHSVKKLGSDEVNLFAFSLLMPYMFFLDG